MKVKKRMVIAACFAILCLCAYFLLSRKAGTDGLPTNAAVIHEETVSPNEKYVSEAKDTVYYTVRVSQAEDHTIYVYAASNSLFFEGAEYSVPFEREVSEEDVQIKWKTLSGSMEATEDDQLGLADVTISQNGDVISQKVISFVGKGVAAIAEAIG